MNGRSEGTGRTSRRGAGASLALALALPALAAAACTGGRAGPDGDSPARGGETETSMSFQLTSRAFDKGGPIPRKHTGEGEDVSPPLSWSGAPEGVREFALICDDPDAPRAEPWVHWVLYRLPPGTTRLEEGSSGGGTEGRNDFGRQGYGGPMPPKGHGAHHYHFRLYALDAPLDLGPGATKERLLQAMQGHILAEAELVGTYER